LPHHANCRTIPYNTAERVKPPKSTKSEALYLDEKQAIELIDLIQDEPINYKTAVEVLLFTGMRRGELLGLQWADIDFDNQIINIRKSLQYVAEKRCLLRRNQKQDQ